MTDNEFLLFDRLTKIRQTIEKYEEKNFYISFSGGKDSTVLSALVDMAIPDNKIPRVYANTGIEYKLILEFVHRLKEQPHSWDLVILTPSVNIKKTLETEGYPFKSKHHSRMVERFNRLGRVKSIKVYLGEQEDKKWLGKKSCPKMLRYQFDEQNAYNYSDKCCLRMKEEPLEKWAKENDKKYHITGIMRSEGGRRDNAECMTFRGKELQAFQPLVPITKEWENWFIDEYKIEIADIYKPPYNQERTGCKGCPFALKLQEELDMLEREFPAEKKQCEDIWKPVYAEYRRLGYRLRKDEYEAGQITIFDLMNESKGDK